MQPIVEPKARTGLGHRLALGALVGVSVVSVAVVALLTVYVDRLSDVASGLHRVDALADYAGRPMPVQVADNPAMNFLVFIDSGEQLQAAVIANLSGSRRDLTLVAVPADLLTSGSGSPLAAAYASSPLRATQLVEKFTGARMDHQLELDLTGFGAVVDGLDGLQLADQQLTGTAAVSYLDQAGSSQDRAQRSAQLIRESMIKAEADGGVLNLPRFDRVIGALGGCLTIDNGLTNDAIQAILVGSRVHLHDVGLWPVSGSQTAAGTQADPSVLTLLRAGLASDSLADTQHSSVGSVARVGAVHSQGTDASTTHPESVPTTTEMTTQDQAPTPAATASLGAVPPSGPADEAPPTPAATASAR